MIMINQYYLKNKMSQMYNDQDSMQISMDNQQQIINYQSPINKSYVNDLQKQRLECAKKMEQIFKLKQKSYLQQLQNIRLKKNLKQFQQCRRTVQTLANLNSQLKAQLHKFKQLNKIDVLQLKSDMEALRNTNDNLLAKLAQAQFNLKYKDLQIMTLSQKNKMLTQSIIKSDGDIQNIKLQKIQLQRRCRLLQMNITNVMYSSKGMNEQMGIPVNGEYLEYLNQKHKENKRLRCEILQLRKKIEDLESEKNNMVQKIKNFEPNINRLNGYKTQNEDLNIKYRQKSAQVQEIKQKWERQFSEKLAVQINKITNYYKDILENKNLAIKKLQTLIQFKYNILKTQIKPITTNQIQIQ